jgi:hypothetical protein
LSKVSAWLLRLIISLSAVETLIQKILNEKQIRKEISQVYTIPSLPGMGLTKPGKLSQLIRMTVGDRFSSLDFSGFDWTQQPVEKIGEALSRAELSISGLYHQQLILKETILGLNAVYCLRDGTLLVTGTPGVMFSGCFYTAAGNSRIAITAIKYCCEGDGIAMGDDGLAPPEFAAPESNLRANALGKKVKQNTIYNWDDYEFCSCRWKCADGVWTIKNLNKAEIVYKTLATKCVTEEQALSWSGLMDDVRYDDLLGNEFGIKIQPSLASAASVGK